MVMQLSINIPLFLFRCPNRNGGQWPFDRPFLLYCRIASICLFGDRSPTSSPLAMPANLLAAVTRTTGVYVTLAKKEISPGNILSCCCNICVPLPLFLLDYLYCYCENWILSKLLTKFVPRHFELYESCLRFPSYLIRNSSSLDIYVYCLV